MSNIPIRDADNVVSYLKSGGTGTELDPYVPIQDVNIQDQTTPQFSLYLGEALDMTVVFVGTQAVNTETLDISSPTLPIVGNFLCCKEGESFTQIEITGVTGAGPAYTVDISIPLDHQYTVAANVCLQNCDMNVNGSVTPVEFFVSPQGAGAAIEWDVTRMILSMTHTSAGDDGLFGNLAALTNGNYFRIEDGTNFNLFNAKENSDFAIEGYDIAYPSRSGGGGVAGTRSRITFNGTDKRGVVFRLAADSGDKFLSSVRDDLTGLTSYRVKVQGQVVSP